jgi:anti-sigma regulatory factor (Ser/Thr protein kinase)
MTQSQALLKVELISNPLLNSGVRELLSAVARRLGFGDEAAGHVALAIDEALCNIEHHGYGRDCGRPIWVSVFALGGLAANGGADSPTLAMKIVIEDEARQVDPATIKSRPLDEVRPGGLGVHIIRQVMDVVVYERREHDGMRLTLVKLRPGVAPAALGLGLSLGEGERA